MQSYFQSEKCNPSKPEKLIAHKVHKIKGLEITALGLGFQGGKCNSLFPYF